MHMIRTFSRGVDILKEYFILKQIGISFNEAINLSRNIKSNNNSELFNKPIKISDNFWHLQSLHEIFIDEVYKFNSLNDKPLIIDCGSNIGMSVIFFKRLFPKAKVIGFEPDPEIFEFLESNIHNFGLCNVELINKAVWIKEDQVYFQPDGSLGGHLTTDQDKNTIMVDTVRLKEFLNEPVDFLKIDIEGAEYEVLQDCADKLVNVHDIFVEYHGKSGHPQMIGELLILLKSAGFRVYVSEAWENIKHPFIEKNLPVYDMQLNISGYRIN